MSNDPSSLPPDQERAVRRVLASQPALSHPITPLPLRRLRIIAVFLPLIFGLSMWPMTYYRSSPHGWRIVWAVLGIQLLGTLSLILLNLRARRQVRDMLAPHNSFVCLRCHYPLTDLPDHGQCPECGTFFLRSEVVRAWRTAFGPPRPTKHRSSLSDDSQML